MTHDRQLILLAALCLPLLLAPQVCLSEEVHVVYPEPHAVQETEARLAGKGPRIGGIFVPSPGVVGTFSRAVNFQRAPLCDILSSILAQESKSVRSHMERQNERECTIEATPLQRPASLNESLFIQVRVEAELVSSLRFKLVIADASNAKVLPSRLAEIAANFFNTMHWNDLAEVSSRVKALVPFDATGYGINLRMIKEETSSDAYDLFVTPRLPSANQAQTYSFEKPED